MDLNRVRTCAHREAVVAKFSVKKTPAKKVFHPAVTTVKRKRKHEYLPENLRQSLYAILGSCDLDTATFTQARYQLLMPWLSRARRVSTNTNFCTCLGPIIS